MKLKRKLAVLLAMALTLNLSGCGSTADNEAKVTAATETAATDSTAEVAAAETESLDYTFGAGETFHSDEAVVYSMMFSDHENYPYKEDWRIFSIIEEKTNVKFDLTLIARSDYEDKKSIMVNSGDATYIIPKTYDESAYVNSGQVVAISDWVQYMPNYQKCVEDWGMASDLQQKLQANGKYYVLPGMWESAGGGYSFIVRKDLFEAAGVDLSASDSWTYETFYEAMKTVKAYTGSDYVLSDTNNAKSTLGVASNAYGVLGGWKFENSNTLKFDTENNKFYFPNTTDEFKEYVTYFKKLIDEGIMDPESFTQDTDAAKAKFFKGDTAVINGNYQNLADFQGLMQVEGAELYMITQPGGPAGMLQVENSRLENGVMIAQKALDELGEEGFIKMLRFVDWLWYSDEGQTLCLWGVEGETYTKDADSKIVLNSDISYNGINVDTATKQLNVDYGFGGGVFAYGGTYDLRTSKMTEGEIDFNNRIQATRELTPLDPPVMADEDQSEEMNLIETPLKDYVATMTMKFMTGQADIATEWDDYVAQCEALGATRFTDTANEIFEDTKDLLGY